MYERQMLNPVCNPCFSLNSQDNSHKNSLRNVDKMKKYQPWMVNNTKAQLSEKIKIFKTAAICHLSERSPSRPQPLSLSAV